MGTKKKKPDMLAGHLAEYRAQMAAITKPEVVAELRALTDQLFAEVNSDDISSEVCGIINDLDVYWTRYAQFEDDDEAEAA